MKRLAILLSGLALSALPCTNALASDLTFSFGNGTVQGTSGPGSVPYSGSGTLTYTTTGTANTYLVTAGTGTVSYGGTTYAISLLPTGNLGFAGNDNLFFNPAPNAFDFNGVAFSLTGSPNYALSLFSALNPATSSITDYELLGVNGGQQLSQQYSAISVTLVPPSTVTPEPGSLALLGTGALGVFGILRRKLSV